MNNQTFPVSAIANNARGYSDTILKLRQLDHHRQDIANCISGDISLITEKLKKFSSVEELTNHLKDTSHVNEFFINEDGTTMDISIPGGKKNLTEKDFAEFKQSVLIYLKQEAIIKDEFDKELKKFDEERKEIEQSMGTSANEIILSYLDLATEKKNELLKRGITGGKELRSTNHILSGFDFNVELETMREHPSIIKNTLNEMHNESLIISYGKRYRVAIKNHQSIATLISFISNTPNSSFEEVFLPPDKYKAGYENLFLFSIIRHFSMTRWTEDTVKMHAMTVSLLQQMVNNELPEEIQSKYVENIAAYLSVFYKEL